MTQICVNKKDFSKETTVEQVLDHVLNNQENNEAIVTEISLDGTIYSIDDSSPILQKTIKDFQSINFSLRTSIELAFEALDNCHTYIDIIIAKVKTLTVCYQENNPDLANETFAEVIEILDLYIQLFSRIFKTIKRTYPNQIKEIKTIQGLEIHLLSILKAVLPAKEKEDIIMLGDLLEYELIDNLTQWKIKAIPALKKLQNL